MKLKQRIILLFIISSLVPVLLLQVYLVGRYSVQQREKISTMIVHNLSQKKNNLDNEIKDYQQILISIMADHLFTDTLDSLLKENSGRNAYLSNIIKNIFSQNTYMKDGLVGFFYYEEVSGLILGYNKQLITPDDFFNTMGGKDRAIDVVEDHGGAISFLKTISVENNAGVPQNLVILGSRFSDLNRTIMRGHIFLLISEKSIYTLLNPPDNSNNIRISETCLLTSGSQVVSGQGKTSLGNTFKLSDQSGFSGKEKYLTREVNLDKLGWRIVTIFREKELFGEVNVFRAFLLFITLLSVSLTALVIRYYRLRVVNTVGALRSSMKIENDQLLFSVKADDDLEYVNQSFQHMKDHINRLLSEQKRKNQRMLEVENEKRLAEISAMEAQVNPHFLYNTLNSLNWMALEKGDEIMSSALTDLAGILRYSISDISVHSTLQEEMHWLDQYLRLQKLRFVDLFDYTLKWDRTEADFKIYKLLFQPFIENAIIHGFEGINYTGTLSITVATKNPGAISIIIEDNGRGFDMDKITISTGLNNPVSRLKLYYRDEAKLKIQSQTGEGTIITLTIPEFNSEITDY